MSGEGQSCPLCSQIDEPELMLAVALPYPRLESHRMVLICKPCAGAIAVRLADVNEVDTGTAHKNGVIDEHAAHVKRKARGRKARETAPQDRGDPNAA
jgi:hypothetical protein